VGSSSRLKGQIDENARRGFSMRNRLSRGGIRASSNHTIAVVVILMLGFGSKIIFYPNRPAEAQSQVATSASMDVFQMHLEQPNINTLPEQTFKEPF
jgi:hypothetical protein